MRVANGYQWKLWRLHCFLTTKGPERGLRFAWHRERSDEEEFRFLSKRVARGKQKHPLDMTYVERREAVRAKTRKMKWSPSFVEAVTTPIALRALEARSEVRDPITGDWFGLGTRLEGFEYDHVRRLTRADFVKDRERWKHNAPLFVSSVSDVSDRPPTVKYEDEL